MELLTERLILREFSSSDWPEVLAYQSHPQYLRYYEWTARTPNDVKQFIEVFLQQQRERPRTKYQLAVALKSDRRLIRNCGIRTKCAGASEGDIG